MTIATVTRKAGPYEGNGVATSFAFSFKVFASSDVVLTHTDEDGVETTLVLDSDFSVTLNADQDDNPGGSITYPLTGSPLPADEFLTVTSDVTETQGTELPNAGGWFPRTVERMFDRVTILVQQVREVLNRSLSFPVSDPATGSELPTVAERAGKVLGFDNDGEMVALAAVPTSSVAITSFWEGVLNKASALLSRVGLGFTFTTPEDHGAVGDGTTDDTAALVAAAATGRHVKLTDSKTYKFTSDVTISTHYQRFGGAGVLKPVGNCGLVVNGSALGVKLDVIVDSSTHTGWAIKVDTAHRVNIRAYLKDCYDGIYVTGANVVTLEWVYGACRHDGIKWYGTTAVRSDILKVAFALLSMGAGRYGFDWDGNCHSLEVDYLGLVCGSSVSASNGYGFILRNTSGGTAPAIGRINHIEVDYSGTHAIDITTGSDIDISVPYILGATGAGIRTGASINDYEVRVASGKSRGNTTYGIQSLGGVVLYDGSTDLSNNTSGKTSGSVWTMSERFALDANAYWAIVTSNPLLSFDSTDYLSYNRSTNTLSAFIGGTAALAVDSTRATFTARPRLPTSTVAALPAVHVAGDMYFATNGRKAGEGGGAGTGVLVFSDGTNWIAVDTGATVAA